MSDVTFGVKVSPEVKEKVNQIIEASGMKSKEWFETVLTLYEMEQLKQGSKDFSRDLSELEIHTNRIVQLVGNMVTRATHEKEKVLQQVEAVKVSKDEIILGYQQELSELKGQIDLYKQQTEQAQKGQQELEQGLKQLQETNENNKALIGEYKEKIDTLSGLVNEYKEYSEENKQLKTTLSELHQENQQKRTEVNELTNELSKVNEQYKVNIFQLEEQHKIKLDRIEERKEVEKERELLGVRTEYQEKLQQTNESYTAKIQSLYEEMNNLRKGFEKQIEASKKDIKNDVDPLDI